MVTTRKKSSKMPATPVEPTKLFARRSSGASISAPGASGVGESPIGLVAAPSTGNTTPPGRDVTRDGEAPGRDATHDDGEAPGGYPTLDDGAALAMTGTTPAGDAATLDDGAGPATSGTTPASCTTDASQHKLSLTHIRRCRRSTLCRTLLSPST